MTKISGFEDLADEFEELANAFDRTQSRDGTTLDISSAIAKGSERAMELEIVPEARQKASDHVPADDAQTIDHQRGEWTPNRYRHYFYATSDLVKYHEFGTGGRASDPSKGTVNGSDFRGRPGYIIRPDEKDALSIPGSRWYGPRDMLDTETGSVAFEYVIHPGVEGKHFMREAMDENAQELRGYILAQINKAFRENGLK